MKTGMNSENAMDATDLTQLSSREQLSALMDGALPADETRFLLRRLQHDASLAECWERWRLSAEVMRGLAPAQRLPADFASRVAASLRGEERNAPGKSVVRARTPAWLRWGGGVAMVASLAVAAVMIRPSVMDAPAAAAVAIADASPASNKAPASQAPTQDPAGMPLGSQAAALATAVAVTAKPMRNARRGNQPRANDQAPSSQPGLRQMQKIRSEIAANAAMSSLLPHAEIATRPWPRAVLPQYGNPGVTVGFGDSTRGAAPYNPFQTRNSIDVLPPALIASPQGQEAGAPEGDEAGSAAGNEPPQS